MPISDSLQIAKYSSRMGRQKKKTFKIKDLTPEQIEEIKQKWFKEIEDDNIKFKQEMYQHKQKMIVPRKMIRLDPEIMKPVEETTTIIEHKPESTIKTTTKEEGNIFQVRQEETKINDGLQETTTKVYQSSVLDKIPSTDLYNIMNNQDIIKNIENKSGNTFLLCGSSKSGKTTFMIDLVNKLYETYNAIYKRPIIIVFSETMANDKGIYNRLPSDTVLIDHYDDKIIKTVEKVQKKTNKKYPIIFVFDDIVDKKGNSTISKCFTIYRNLNISTIILLQRMRMFDKTNRANINYVFLLKQNNSEGIRDLMEIFLKGKMTSNDYIQATSNYSKLYLDNLNDLIYRLN